MATRTHVTNIMGPQGPRGGRGLPGRDGGGPAVSVAGGITEWWIYPVANLLKEPYTRVLSASYAEDGRMEVSESILGAGTESVTVWDGPANGWPVDDHDAPALWARDGHRPVVAWTEHSGNTNLYMRVGDREASLSGLRDAPLVTLNLGRGCTYAQIHRIEHLSTSTVDRFYVFVRAFGQGWSYFDISVNQVSGAVTNHGITPVFSMDGMQAYMQVMDAHATSGNQVLRIAAYPNPSQPVNMIWYLELDVVTGLLSSSDATVDHDLSSGPIDLYSDSIAHVYPLVNPGGLKTRLFYVRPGTDSPAIAWASWPEENVNSATYHLTERSGSSWSTTDLGPAGPPAASHYFSGMAFADPSTKGEVWIARDGTPATLERSYIGRDGNRVSEVLYETDEARIYRPHLPVPATPVGPLFSEVTSYPSYNQFTSDLRSLRGTGVGARSVPSLAVEGTLLLFDPLASGWDATSFSDGDTIPNAANRLAKTVMGWDADYPITIENTISSATGLVERSRLGGLHVAVSHNGSVSGEHLSLNMSVRTRNFLNNNQTHHWYVGLIGAVTRKRVTGTNTHEPFWAGIESPTASWRPEWMYINGGNPGTSNIGTQPTWGDRVLGRTTSPSDINTPFLVDVAVSEPSEGFLTAGLEARRAVMAAGNVAEPMTDIAQSSITYVVMLEDLSVSGRSYQEVHRAMLNRMRELNLSNDTYTQPSSLD